MSAERRHVFFTVTGNINTTFRWIRLFQFFFFTKIFIELCFSNYVINHSVSECISHRQTHRHTHPHMHMHTHAHTHAHSDKCVYSSALFMGLCLKGL